MSAHTMAISSHPEELLEMLVLSSLFGRTLRQANKMDPILGRLFQIN